MTKRRWTWVWTTLFVFGLGACGGGNQSAIEGKLVDSDGKPVSGMRITASQVQPLKGYEQLGSVSKSDGTFRITGLFPSSTYVLESGADKGYAGAAVRIQSAPQGATAVVPDPILIVPAFCTEERVPATNPDSAYIDHGNGTVTDKRTGLMWKQCPEGLSGAACQTGSTQGLNWTNAVARAESSTLANHTDWRLPSKDELLTLVEACRNSPAINTTRFPNTPSSFFWSGSPYANYSNSAWYVSFGYGGAYVNNRSNDFRVRLVRGGQ